MSALHNTQPVHPVSSTRRQLVLFYLLVGGTALLLAWLAVGFAPSTWWLLFQVIRQFNTLWAQQETSLLWSLLLLIVQSLLLLAAWILLIRVAVQESARFYAMLPEKAKQASSPSVAVANIPASLQPAPPLTPPPPLEAPTLLQPVRVTLVPDQPAAHAVPPLAQLPHAEKRTPAQSRPVRKTRPAPSEHLAQAAQAIHISEVPTQMNTSPSSNTPGSLTQQETSPGYSTQLPFPAQQPISGPGRIGEQVKSTEKAGQTFANEARKNDPYEASNPYTVADIFAKEEQVSFPEPRLVGQDKRNNDAADDPFAIQEETLKLFRQEGFPEEAEHQKAQAQPSKEQDQIFVFGNPFEGPLPDVFEHDEDLKRSIMEQGIRLPPTHTPSNRPATGESHKPPRPKKRQ